MSAGTNWLLAMSPAPRMIHFRGTGISPLVSMGGGLREKRLPRKRGDSRGQPSGSIVRLESGHCELPASRANGREREVAGRAQPSRKTPESRSSATINFR